MHRTIVVGSPREDGRSACLAQELFEACVEECPDDGVSVVSVAGMDVRPCRGCDACKGVFDGAASEDACAAGDGGEGDPLPPVCQVAESDAARHACVIADDMGEVRTHVDAADELVVVCPVYFAGAPAQMKALLDRLQPYYWSNVREAGRKRPLTLHVVGEGGDPHGFAPLVGVVRSAFSVAGFRLERILDWRGKIDANDGVLADADEVPVPKLDAGLGLCTPAQAPSRGAAEDVAGGSRPQAQKKAPKKQRPTLSLSGPSSPPASPQRPPRTPRGKRGSKRA